MPYVVLEKTLESPFNCKETKPVSPKGSQPQIFIGRTDAEAEVPIIWPLDSKSRLIRKYSDAGKGWRQEEKGMREDEMVGWHHQLNAHGTEQALGDGKQQGNLLCCSPWGCKQSDMTEWQNNNNNTHSMDIRKLWKIVKDREAWHTAVHGVAKSQTQLSDWTTITQVTQQLRICLPLFLPWLLWPTLPKLCWIVVVRVGTLVLFLISGEMLSIFHLWG